VQALGAWLRSIDIDAGADALTPEELAAALREHLLAGALAEPGEPAPGDGSPPLALRLHPDDAAAALALAYRVWVNEVRPALSAEAGPCAPPADGDDGQCVLLACIQVPYAEGADGRLAVTGDIVIDTACAPLLVQTRVLQELSLGAPCCATEVLLPAADDSPPAGGVGPSAHGDLLDLEADDHPQYLLVDTATRALLNHLSADGNLIVDLGETAAPTGAEAVRWDRAVKNADPAGGDLAGSYPAPAVAALQGNPVAPGALEPADAGRVLLWDGGAWQAGQLPVEAGLVRIIRDAARAPPRRQSRQRSGHRLRHRRGPAGRGAPRHPQRPCSARLPAAGGVPRRRADLVDRRPAADGGAAGARHAARRRNRFDRSNRDPGRRRGCHRPGGARLGTRGGRFESWVTAGRLFIPIGGIELNSASAAELTQLPGIGGQLAARIVERRERLGDFASVEELAGVQGVTAPVLNRLRALLDN